MRADSRKCPKVSESVQECPRVSARVRKCPQVSEKERRCAHLQRCELVVCWVHAGAKVQAGIPANPPGTRRQF
eukprot:1138091-Prorocentrum_minimum.AAC.1